MLRQRTFEDLLFPHRMDDRTSTNRTKTKGEVDARQETKPDTDQELQLLQKANGEDAIRERSVGRHGGVHEASLLQSELHGERDGGDDQNHVAKEQQETVEEASEACVRKVRTEANGNKTVRSPHRRKSDEQRGVKLEDALRFMPSAYALAISEGDTTTAEVLQTLFPSSMQDWAVQQTLWQGVSKWRSPSNQEVERAWEAGLLSGFAIVPISPLAYKQPNRRAALHGLGNAICPPLAAEFIKAFMEAEHAVEHGQ